MPFQKGHKINLGKKFALGYKHTSEWKQNMSEKMRGNTNGFSVGKPSPRKGVKSTKPSWRKGKKFPEFSGVNHPNWIADRSKVKLELDRGGPLHKQWSRSVKSRDNWRCKIDNTDCEGKVVAHHVLSWRNHPELRYILNNGITLCHAHHPRKRMEEERLIPTFLKYIDLTVPYSNSEPKADIQ